MLSVIGENAPNVLIRALESKGDTVITLPPHPALPQPVASHADLLVFFSKKGIYTFRSYAMLAESQLNQISELLRLPIRICEEEPSDRYPQDTLLDALPMGNFLFCRPSSTASILLQENDLRVVSVAQGYTKCAALPIGTSALITSDPSIAAACEPLGIACLMLPSGGICLPGYNTGFIGGASSFSPLCDSREVLLCGDLASYRSGAEIEEFCCRYNKIPISLGNIPLTDIGTVFRFEI